MAVMAVCLVLLHLGWESPPVLRWVNSFLDDCLVLPLVLGGVLVALRLLRQEPGWTVPLRFSIVAMVVYTVYFELILPQFTSRATGDPRDVLAYAAGFLFFTLVINRPCPGGPQGE